MISNMQGDVEEFHRAFGHTVGNIPAVRDEKLRINLISEEAKELQRALAQEDLLEVIDGACDLIYVVLGTMVAAGVPIEPFWREVHKANMAKLVPCTNCDGDGSMITGTLTTPASKVDCKVCHGTGKVALKREIDGKVMRPEGWQPPALGPILDEVIRHAHDGAKA